MVNDSEKEDFVRIIEHITGYIDHGEGCPWLLNAAALCTCGAQAIQLDIESRILTNFSTTKVVG